MPEPATAAIGAIVGLTSLFGIGKPDTPSAPTPPQADPTTAEEQARTNRLRAVQRSGRQSTLLVDDTETPVGQQIPQQNIGRKTLLGG